jgi:hypothetical protein
MLAEAAVQQPSTPSPSASDKDGQRVEPIFRKTKADEQRVEGLLQRIDCSIRGRVAFVVQTADQTVRMSAPKMQDVEFITYREDVTGDVKCGPLKEPMRVYLTSRDPSKPGAERVVTAVEFLPKEPL